MVAEGKLFFFPSEKKKVPLVLQALKHSVLLENIRMCLFWEGEAAKDLEKNTRLRKKAKRMWVVQVGNGGEGVKNLFVVRGKKENGDYSCWQPCHRLLCSSQLEL